MRPVVIMVFFLESDGAAPLLTGVKRHHERNINACQRHAQ